MNRSDIRRDAFMLKGALAKKGYDWWWHSFTGINKETGEEKPFFIEYFVCNPAHAKDEPVIVWNDEEARNNGVRPSYLMVKIGYWGKDKKGQIHNFYPWKDVEIAPKVPINIKVGDNICTEKHIKGSVSVSEQEAIDHPEWMCNAGEFSWDLKVDKKVSYNVGYGASGFFRKINAFEMFWHAEGMKTEFDGWVKLDGVEYEVKPDTCYGYSDKNWGGDFTSPWVWLSSNNITSNITGKKLTNSVFEVGGGRPKIFFYALNRKLLGQCYYEGDDYEFNFSKFWTGSKTMFDCKELDDEILWNVTQSTFKTKMEVEIHCKKEDMILINYEAPNGTKRHNNLWNGGNGWGTVKLYRKKKGEWNLIDDMHVENVGCEYGEYDP